MRHLRPWDPKSPWCRSRHPLLQMPPLGTKLVDPQAQGILLDIHGNVAENKGGNFFIVADGVLSVDDIDSVIRWKGEIIGHGGLLEFFPVEANTFELGGFPRLKQWLDLEPDLLANRIADDVRREVSTAGLPRRGAADRVAIAGVPVPFSARERAESQMVLEDLVTSAVVEDLVELGAEAGRSVRSTVEVDVNARGTASVLVSTMGVSISPSSSTWVEPV